MFVVSVAAMMTEISLIRSVLSKQSVVLEDAGYVEVRKGAVGRRPRTWFWLTAKGRQALEGHLAWLTQLEGAVAAGTRDVTQVTANSVNGRLAPQDLRGRDRRHGHRLDLDVGARLISVDLQEHVADAQGRALVMGDDDLDLFHSGHYRGMTTDVANGFTACGCAAGRVPLPGGR